MCMSMAGTGITVQASDVQREVINFALSQDPGNLSPWGNTTTAAKICYWGVYQPLGTITDGKEDLILLKNYEYSEDGLEMYCEIWDYIYDSDGNHITADDVKFSWDTGLELGGITGVTFVDSLEVTGDYTFTFHFNSTLTTGDSVGLFKWNVVSQAAYEASGDGMAVNPVGTGPYVISDYVSGSGFTSTLRDDYWQTDEYNSIVDGQNVGTINWFIITESSQRTIALQTGQVDICQDINSLDIAQFDEGGEYDDEYNIYGINEDMTLKLYPNCTSGAVTDDVNLRLAIFYAIDNETILNSVYSGIGTAAHELMANWATGYNSDWDTEDNYYNYDPEKAAEYLAQSNYNGEELVLIMENEEVKTNAAQLIQVFLQQIGINVTLSTVESSSFGDYVVAGEWDLCLRARAFNIYVSDAWWGDLSEDRWGDQGSMNFVKDETLQELIAASKELDSTQEDLDTLHQYIIDNAYIYGIVNPYDQYVIPSDMTEVVTTFQLNIIPGACSYE